MHDSYRMEGVLMTDSIAPKCSLVVGIVPGQSRVVFEEASALALTLEATLHFAYVDTSSIGDLHRQMSDDGLGSFSGVLPFDSDAPNDTWERVGHDIEEEVAAALSGKDVAWDFLHLTGEPVDMLARLADKFDARYIIVGTREPGPGPHLRELLGGSVASGLAHHQHHPVLVVPLRPDDK
jgi:nucleotide-binding universal stress UspA family protein